MQHLKKIKVRQNISLNDRITRISYNFNQMSLSGNVSKWQNHWKTEIQWNDKKKYLC
jgi:hypothetical protein